MDEGTSRPPADGPVAGVTTPNLAGPLSRRAIRVRIARDPRVRGVRASGGAGPA
jgi:hypothetical protein